MLRESISKAAPRYSPAPTSLAGKFAERVGITHAHAEQLVHGGNNNLRDRVIAWIHTCRSERKAAVLDRWMRPILEAFFESRPQSYGPQLLREAVKADAQEDVARTEWQLGAEKVDAYLRVLDREIAEKCALREALAKSAGR